jgi:hypothetical protein
MIIFYWACQNYIAVFNCFFSTIPYAALPKWDVLNRALCFQLHPHRFKHCSGFAFFHQRRKTAGHPLCEWSVTQNMMMENGEYHPDESDRKKWDADDVLSAGKHGQVSKRGAGSLFHTNVLPRYNFS